MLGERGDSMWSPDLSETVGGYGAGGNISTGYPGTTLTEHPKPVWKMGHLHNWGGFPLNRPRVLLMTGIFC